MGIKKGTAGAVPNTRYAAYIKRQVNNNIFTGSCRRQTGKDRFGGLLE